MIHIEMLKKGKKNLCIIVDESFANALDIKAETLQTTKQAVTALLLRKWLNGEVNI